MFQNVKIISDFMEDQNNRSWLHDILRIFDEGIPDQINWERIGLYQFKGHEIAGKNVYQIDFYRGHIYKNKRQLEVLNSKVRSNKNYIDIFGKKRVFRVYPSNQPGYLRTKDSFST